MLHDASLTHEALETYMCLIVTDSGKHFVATEESLPINVTKHTDEGEYST